MIFAHELHAGMSEMGGGPNFYGGMPDSYSLVVNANHPLVIKVIESKEAAAKPVNRIFK